MKTISETFAIGDRVEFPDAMGRAWGVAGKQGAVTGGDPRGMNDQVVQVQLDDGTFPFGDHGVHITNLIRI